MERLRIGVIGLGWFGEIHCETIVGVPNLELAALCTRTPERLAAMAAKFGVSKTYRDYHDLLADPEIDAVSIVTMWDQHTEPATRGARGRQARLPREADGLDRRRLPARSSQPRRSAQGILLVGHICRFNPRYRMAKQAIENGTIGRIVSLSSRRNIPAAWTPEILNKIGPIVGDAIHDTDLMLWFTGDRIDQRLRADGRRARPEAPRHRPDDVPLRGRRDGDARDRLVHAGAHAVRHRRAHDDHRHRGVPAHPGHVPESRHRLARRLPQPGHDLLAGVRRRAGRRACARSSPTSRAARWPARSRRSGVPRTRWRRSPQRSQPRSRHGRARSCGSMPSSIEVEPIDRCMRCM